MSFRLPLCIGLVAVLCGFVDEASARQRRLFGRTRAMIVESRPEPTLTKSEIETSDTDVNGKLAQVVYPVADLVVPIQTRETLEVGPLPGPLMNDRKGFVPWQASQSKPQALQATSEDDLINLVTSSVASKTWNGRGGRGTIQYFPLGMSLVVNQTKEVQEEVKNLLTSLQKLYTLEVGVEINIFTAAPETFARACKNLNLKWAEMKAPPSKAEICVVPLQGSRGSTTLSSDDLKHLLNQLQDDSKTTIAQQPKLTLFNDQKVVAEFTKEKLYLTRMELIGDGDNLYFSPQNTPFKTGLRLGLHPVVSGDRRYVRLEINGSWAHLAGQLELQPVQMPIKKKNEHGKLEEVTFQMFLAKPRFARVHLKQDVSVPDGGTLLCNCGVVPMEIRNELLATVTEFLFGREMTVTEDRQVLVLITPRVIVHAAEEQAFHMTPVRVHGSVGP
ncbi:MAG: hypothetical protein HY040_03440 [Planctomycetes bacterium]|nr:hypothetical protein [Planctomycetota bacterium]